MNVVLIMQSGKFIARPHVVGTTEEELVAMVKGTVAPERVQEIQNNMRHAAFSLGASAPVSRC